MLKHFIQLSDSWVLIMTADVYVRIVWLWATKVGMLNTVKHLRKGRLALHEGDEAKEDNFLDPPNRLQPSAAQKMAIYVHNYTPSGAQKPQRYLGNFTSCTTFGAHKLVRFEPFSDYLYKFDNCCQCYIASCGKNLCRCNSTFSALNYFCGIFFKSLSYLYEVGRTHFSADFWTYRNFWPQFRENCAPSSDENKNYLAILKGQSLLKRSLKKNQNRPINRDTLIQTMSPSNEQRAGLRAWQTNKNIQTPYFRTYSRRAMYDLPKLCMVIELVEPSKKM